MVSNRETRILIFIKTGETSIISYILLENFFITNNLSYFLFNHQGNKKYFLYKETLMLSI